MGFIPEEVIAQVLERCDIIEIVSSYIPLKPAGRNFKTNCPFHNEKTPSFVVSPDKQIFHCFGCGAGGNVFHFVMKQERFEFPEAVRMLAEKVNVPIPEKNKRTVQTNNLRQKIFHANELASDYFYRNLLSDNMKESEEARRYLKKRGVTLESVKQFQLGIAPHRWDGLIGHLKGMGISLDLMEQAGLIIARDKGQGYYDRFRNRIMFPILDVQNHCRAFGARTLELNDSKENVGAKYVNSPETSVYIKGHHLYGFHLARQSIVQKDLVIIVEGYLDCLIPYQAGVTNIVASLGTALTVEQIRLLRRYTKNVCLLFDMDKAGQNAMLRSLDLLVEEGLNVRMATLTKGDDPDSFIRQNGREAFEERIACSQGLFDYKLNILRQRHDVNIIEGKAAVVQDMLKTINRFSNEVIKAEYVNRLSRELNVQEQALWAELKKESRGIEKRFVEINQDKSVEYNKTVKRIELGILKLFLDDQSFISAAKAEIPSSEFQDKKIRSIISKIYQLFEEGQEITAGHLLGSLSDEGEQKMISSLAASQQEVEVKVDRKKMYRDYVHGMKQNRKKIQIKELQERIRQAEYAGNNEQLSTVMKEYHQLCSMK